MCTKLELRTVLKSVKSASERLYGKFLTEAFEVRGDSDCDGYYARTKEEAEEQIQDAPDWQKKRGKTWRIQRYNGTQGLWQQ